MTTWGSMLGAGLLVVANSPERSMLDLALNATRFFRNESCGKCVPCRVGSEKLVKIGNVSRQACVRARKNLLSLSPWSENCKA